MKLARVLMPALLASACAAEPVPLTWGEGGFDPSPTNPDGARAIVPVTLTVSTLIPDAPATFTVTGAGPGELVHIARSTGGLGAGPCFGTAGALCLDVRAPVAMQGSATADATGTAVLEQRLSSRVSIGGTVAFQAVIPRGASGLNWDESAPVEVVIQDATLTASDLGPGDLLVTEIMADPGAVADNVGEWFEVVNATSDDMNLDGIVLSDGVNDHVVSEVVYLAPGGRAVFGASTNKGSNGGVAVDHAWSGLTLANDWGEVYVMDPSGTIIDGVGWDDGATFPHAQGVSMVLSGLFQDASDNDIGAHWCDSSDPYGAGDLGSPGADVGCPNDFVECLTATEIDDPTRLTSYTGVAAEDCDDSMGGQWYRFVGSGTRIPETAPTTYRCGTDAPGWLSGGHPALGDGIASRTVNFHWNNNPSNWSAQVSVINCGDYFVYNLPDVPACDLRYCTE
jgi:hypothetical protein